VTGYVDVYKSGYLHRDIKPANIFYRNGSYKIGDFGFAIPAKDSH
jgi:serine/threonine protein kinase